MDSSIFRRSLDIHQQTTQTHLAVRKGDTARKIVAALSDGGRPYRIEEGCYAVFKGKKPDGNVLYNNCTIENNCIVYEFTEQTAASAGHMPCEFQLYGPDGKIITSPKFSLIVSGLVYDDSEVESSGEFTALEKAMADVAELKATGLRGDEGPMGPQGPMGPTGKPFRVTVFPPGIVEEPYEDLQQEYEAGRELVCRLETEDQQYLELPLVETKGQPYVFRFNAVSGGVEWTAEISRGPEGAAVSAVSQIAYAPVQPATDEKYFDITADGIISLKPEYRGASPAAADSASMGLSVSDCGTGLVGSRNRALPEDIIIPATVGGVTVTGYAPGMFYYNARPRKITLLPTVAAIPTGFCGYCRNLREVAGTEGVRTIGQQGFAYSGITEIRLPGLTELAAGGSQFQCCAHLMVADLGGTIESLPKACFRFCEKLARLDGCEQVETLGSLALFATKSLKELPFLGNLDMEEVNKPGVLAVMLSRANPTGFIDDPGGNYTACATRMYSTFEQNNPLWAWKPIVGLRQYDRGCMYVSFAMMYSALEKQELRTPEEFVQALFAANPDLAQEDAGADGTLAGLEHIAQTMADTWGHSWTLYREVTPAAVQAVYDALATTGKTKRVVIQARVVGDESGSNHAVVIYGVNADGEVLVVDSESAAQGLDIYEAAVYAMPIRNLCRATDYLLVMRKED